MAIARMVRVTLLGHRTVLEAAVNLVQKAGVVELVTGEPTQPELTDMHSDAERLRELEERIADATFVRDLLGRFHTNTTQFSTFISEKVHLSSAEYDALDSNSQFEEVYRECEVIAERLAEIERERTRLHELVHELAPWESLRLQISQSLGTKNVAMLFGTVPVLAADDVRTVLHDAADLVDVAQIGRAAEREAWVVMVHRDALDEVRSALLLTEFTDWAFPEIGDYPAEERARALDRLGVLEAEQREMEDVATRISEAHYATSVALVQTLLTRKDAEEAKDSFSESERAFVASGWMPEPRKEELLAALDSVSAGIDVSFSEPRPGEHVPVELSNPAFIRPFEVLTDLYGRPRYGAVDPTPLFAGFFFLFFGLCIGDVGYGLMLGVAAWLIKTRLDVAPGVRKFMDLLVLGGIASALVGIATRSYFALPEESLPGFLRYEPLIDPLRDVMVMLAFSVALGVLHISLGILASAYGRFRAGDVLGAVSEDISTLAFFVVVGAVLVWPSTIGWLLPWSLVALVVLKGRVIEQLVVERSVGGAAMGVGKGLLGLYGFVGYASDFLSYTRLAALGLASLLVGDTMNRLAGLVAEIPYGVGIIGALLILVVGHTFNVVIALLGAFVHPTRLQFVEFFGKFYEAGGRPFAPLAQRTKQVVLHPGMGESEGGVR